MNNNTPLPEPLTKREQEILACLVEGLSNREIAGRIHLAHRTVKWYNSQIYSKLGVNRRKEAVEKARALGLLDTLLDNPTLDGKHNLPSQTTPFIGRRHEISELKTLLNDDNTRLVTILAPGGMGKTRLSQEVARTQIGHYRDGLYFVPLAPLSSHNDIVTTIAENIGFVFHGENPPAHQLVDFLKDRMMLLVLDNFEHLLEGTPYVSDIVKSAQNVKVLVTSRERLNLRGETVYTLHGLDFPTWETPDDALEYDAVKLFMQSANRARFGYELYSDDLDFLARICRLTAGLPLGIELAAGWVDVLPLGKIADEIQRGIDILETELRDVPERHRSLRATFERTWNRLTENEQTVFARLSVFRGGFSLESTEVVADANSRHLRKLAQKSLIQTKTSERYAIHELLRQFGEGKLAETDEHPTIQAKHAQYFADFMAERQQDVKGSRQLEALQLIESDYENLRTAWVHLVDHGDWGELPKFLHGFKFYWDMRSRGQEAVELLEYAIDVLRSIPTTKVSELALGQMLAWQGWAKVDIGLFEQSIVLCNEAIQILKQYDSPQDLLAAHHHLLYPIIFRGELSRAMQVGEEGVHLATQYNEPFWEANILVFLGSIVALEQDYEAGIQLLKQALSIFKTLNIRQTIAEGYLLLGITYSSQKQYEDSAYWLEQALPILYRFDTAVLISLCHNYLSVNALGQGNFAIARQHLRKALLAHWQSGYNWAMGFEISLIAQMLTKQGNTERAIELLAAVYSYSHWWSQGRIDINDIDVLLEELKAKIKPEQFASAWQRGQEIELSALIIELLSEFEDV